MSDVLIDRPELNDLGTVRVRLGRLRHRRRLRRAAGISEDVVTDISRAQERARVDAEDSASRRSRSSA